MYNETLAVPVAEDGRGQDMAETTRLSALVERLEGRVTDLETLTRDQNGTINRLREELRQLEETERKNAQGNVTEPWYLFRCFSHVIQVID